MTGQPPIDTEALVKSSEEDELERRKRELREDAIRKEDDAIVRLWAKLNAGQDLRQILGWERIVQLASAWGHQAIVDNPIRGQYD